MRNPLTGVSTMNRIKITLPGPGPDEWFKMINARFEGTIRRIQKLAENPIFASCGIEENIQGLRDLQFVLKALFSRADRSQKTYLANLEWSAQTLKVPLDVYRQLLALDNASEYSFEAILQLARTGICHGPSMERCGLRMRELRSRLNSALAIKIAGTEIQQTEELRRMIFKDSRPPGGG